MHVKVHPVATVVVAVVNPIQHAQASTAWRAVAVVVLAVMVAAVVVDLAVAVAAVVVALAVVMVAVTAVVVHSAADQQRLNASLAIRPSMVGNGPIIELHFGTPQFAVLGHPAPHSGAPHLE